MSNFRHYKQHITYANLLEAIQTVNRSFYRQTKLLTPVKTYGRNFLSKFLRLAPTVTYL